MILVVFLFVIILLLLVYLYRKRQQGQEEEDIIFLTQKTAELEKQREEQDKNTEKAAEDVGLDKDDIIEASRLECGFGLDASGGCSGDMVLDEAGKCCTLKEGSTPTKAEIALKMSLQIVQDIIIGEVVEQLLLVIGPRVVQALGQGIAKRAVGTAVGKLAGKMALNAGKFAKFAAGGPFTAASVAFEIGSALLDLFDPAGYSLFIPNSQTEKVRNQLETKFQTSVPRNQWPYIFPISLVFPDEFKLAIGELTMDFVEDAITTVANKEPELFGEYFVSILTGETFTREEEFNKMIEDEVSESINKNPKQRDEKIYDKLIETVKPTYRGWIRKYTFLSNKDRIAVSLSRTGVEQWNKYNELKWRRWDSNKENSPPLFAVYKNTYRSVNRGNPGDASNPNMIERNIQEKVALAYPYYPLIALCEDTKRGNVGKVEKGSVNPYSYGVRFNPDTGTCRFTPAYCRRFQLEYNGSGNTGCGYYDGQEFAELIFGTTVTRGVMEAATQTKEFFEDLF
jgi:uncharacterized protein (DUF697 family)